MSLWYHFTQLEIVTITYLSITFFFCDYTIQSPFNPSPFLKPPRTCEEEKWHMGLHRNSSDFHPSHTGRGSGFYLQARGTHTLPEEKLWVGDRWGGGVVDEWNGAQCAGTELTQLPSSHTSAASLFTLTGSRLRAKISSHVLTEGQGDTVLRMNGHVMLSML